MLSPSTLMVPMLVSLPTSGASMAKPAELLPSTLMEPVDSMSTLPVRGGAPEMRTP
ncbi:hypothetical protein D3C81_2211390 [compost metagenome]